MLVRATRGPWIVAVLASVTVWAFGVFGAYGWFTDELYFLSCAKRPAIGYVDQPPLAPLLLTALRAVAGDTLWVFRLVSAVVFAASILVGARLARQLGGGAFAQIVAAVLIATTPAILVLAGFYSMNPLDVLVAMGLASVAVAIVDHGAPRLWLAFGALVGIGFINKHTSGVTAAVFAVAAVAFAPAVRAHLATRWPYLGVLVAVVIAAPHLAWLVEHDWIPLEFYAESNAHKNIETSPLGVLGGQALFVGPLGFAFAIGGAVSLARQPGRRGFGLALFVGIAAMMIAGVSRPDRILGLYPLALAAGAVAFERVTERRRRLRPLVLAAYAVGAAIPLPLLVPVLAPSALASYAERLGFTPQLERQKPGAMPQWMADRLGWEDLVAQTAAVVGTLSAEERAQVVLLGKNYGVAGALELYGPAYGLPARVISTHNAWWMWGPIDSEVLVAITEHERRLRRAFTDVQRAGTVACEHCFEGGTPIWIARGPRVPLSMLWPGLRNFE